MIRERGLFTLLGSKPATWVSFDYAPPTPEERLSYWQEMSSEMKAKYSLDDLEYPKYNTKQLLQEWNRIQDEYTGTKYGFIPDGEYSMFFVHKKNLQNVIKENHSLFTEILGCSPDIECIIHCKSIEDSPTWQRIKASHTLMGLILGYGRHNSECYERMREGAKVPSSYFHTSKNYAKQLYSSKPKLRDLELPLFRVFNGEGEKQLDLYNIERRKIVEALNKGNIYRISHREMIQ